MSLVFTHWSTTAFVTFLTKHHEQGTVRKKVSLGLWFQKDVPGTEMCPSQWGGGVAASTRHEAEPWSWELTPSTTSMKQRQKTESSSRFFIQKSNHRGGFPLRRLHHLKFPKWHQQLETKCSNTQDFYLKPPQNILIISHRKHIYLASTTSTVDSRELKVNACIREERYN